MTEGTKEPAAPLKFINNELGITHFISGKGTQDEPFEPLGATSMKDALIDAWTTALYSGGGQPTFLEFNETVIGVDKDMNITLPQGKDIASDDIILKELKETAEQLKKKGHRTLTPEELEKVRREFQKPKGVKGILNRLQKASRE